MAFVSVCLQLLSILVLYKGLEVAGKQESLSLRTLRRKLLKRRLWFSRRPFEKCGFESWTLIRTIKKVQLSKKEQLKLCCYDIGVADLILNLNEKRFLNALSFFKIINENQDFLETEQIFRRTNLPDEKNKNKLDKRKVKRLPKSIKSKSKKNKQQVENCDILETGRNIILLLTWIALSLFDVILNRKNVVLLINIKRILIQKIWRILKTAAGLFILLLVSIVLNFLDMIMNGTNDFAVCLFLKIWRILKTTAYNFILLLVSIILNFLDILINRNSDFAVCLILLITIKRLLITKIFRCTILPEDKPKSKSSKRKFETGTDDSTKKSKSSKSKKRKNKEVEEDSVTYIEGNSKFFFKIYK